MILSEDTLRKLDELVDLLERDNPNLDPRLRCGVLQKDGGRIILRLRNLSLKQLERWFWSMAIRDEQTSCWEWKGTRDRKGYGFFKAEGKRWLAHRVAIAYVTGESSSLFACHRCDNPPCVNPLHIFRGTAADNFRDMQSKGRGGRLNGEANPNAKITWEQVREIRTSTAPLVRTAERLGIEYHHAWRIRAGRVWKYTEAHKDVPQ